MVFCLAINCKNNTKSRVRTLKLSEDPKFRERWLVKMKLKQTVGFGLMH